jgi:ribonuclease R
MEVSAELVDQVLRLVNAPDYRPIKPKQIAQSLGLDTDDYRELKRVVKALVHRGQLRYGSNHLVLPPELAWRSILAEPGVRISIPTPEARTETATPEARIETPTPADKISPDAPASRWEASAAAASAEEEASVPSTEEEFRGQRPAKGTSATPRSIARRVGFVRGTFRGAMGGFGFVRPGDALTAGDSSEDIFIPPGATGGALDGDTVEVRLRPRSERRGDEDEGYVDKVLARGRRQFTGTVEIRSGAAWVHLDGVPWNHPIRVGDVRGLPVENDDKVFVELVKFPSDAETIGEGVILEVLGKTNNPAIDTLTILRQYGLAEAFPEEVLRQARQQADAFAEGAIPPERRDLTGLLTLTIDPADARDFDDAISLEKSEGFWTLWVHIADVTAFVPEGGPIDQEAQRRATSVYLPDRVVPMIPELISNHLASLQPDQVRLAKTVEIEMTDDGIVTSFEVYNSAIRSDRRFNYEQIDEFIESPDAKVEAWGEPICELLKRMHTLAMGMRRSRFRRGSLTLDLPEVKIDLDKGGKVKGAHVVAYTESHQIIEEFMLAANQAVATWLDDQKLQFLHRIHPAPDRRKLRQLEQFVTDLRLPVATVQGRRDMQRVLDLALGTPLENAVNFAVLKSMNKAIYAPHREGHYALDMEHYCHFTSPIRRYPDLTVHRLVQNLIDKKPTPDEAFPVLLRLGFHCSDQERNAAAAERELVQLKLLHFMKKKIGESMRVIISRVFPDGILARGIEVPVEGYLPITALPSDRYRFERRGMMIVGHRESNQFRLGDELSVKVSRVDLRERELVFELIKNLTVGRTLVWNKSSRDPGFGDVPVTAKRPKRVTDRQRKKEKKKIRRSKR